MDESKLENRLTTLETNQQYMADQIVDMQDMQREIRDLALSVNDLAGSVKRLVQDVCAAQQRLDAIEHRPAMWLDRIINLIIGAAVGGIIGFIITRIVGG